MDYINDLHDMCEMLGDEITEQTEKIKKAGKMSAGDLEAVDKLTHALKSIKTTIAMEDGYSSRADGSYRGKSYAQRRDSRGRYVGNYSRAEDGMEDIVAQLREMMRDLPPEKQREVQRFVEKVERM